MQQTDVLLMKVSQTKHWPSFNDYIMLCDVYERCTYTI